MSDVTQFVLGLIVGMVILAVIAGFVKWGERKHQKDPHAQAAEDGWSGRP